MSTVSVIMPVYNQEKYIRYALDSVMFQTYPNIEEVIIINDASTDGTENILKEYKRRYPDKIRIFTQRKNRGVARSLNWGLKKASGNYIARIDADDVWLIDKLEKQIRILEEDNELYMLATSKQLIDKKGKLFDGKPDEPVFSYNNVREYILRKNIICHSSVVFRREIVDKVGLYNERYKNSEDYEYWMRIIFNYKTEVLPEKLTYYRITKGMTSLRRRGEQIRYAIKAKMFGIKLFSKGISAYRYILPDLYELSKPRFMSVIKQKILNKQSF
ncbi:MAG: glycosyltransferase [Bacteroidales bacterium]|jgi:glycosyltransferase involved in cell wall biosynthesis|nr:glycosyltransferase [Bacteroidales bacterium]